MAGGSCRCSGRRWRWGAGWACAVVAGVLLGAALLGATTLLFRLTHLTATFEVVAELPGGAGPHPHIPGVVHQTYATTDIPFQWRASHRSWTRQCPLATAPLAVGTAAGREAPRHGTPACRVVLWTDASARAFLQERHAWFLPTFDGYRFPIQRVDALRYFLLFEFGGVYADLDVACRTAVPRLRGLSGVVLPETWPMGVSNDFVVAEPGHPFLRQVVHALPRWDWWFGIPYFTVMASTGPLFLSIQACLYTGQAPLYILPSRLYAGRHAALGHTAGSSWHSWDAAFLLWLAAHPWTGLALVTLALALACSAGAALCRRRQPPRTKTRAQHNAERV